MAHKTTNPKYAHSKFSKKNPHWKDSGRHPGHFFRHGNPPSDRLENKDRK
jgi:hypothetical protein